METKENFLIPLKRPIITRMYQKPLRYFHKKKFNDYYTFLKSLDISHDEDIPLRVRILVSAFFILVFCGFILLFIPLEDYFNDSFNLIASIFNEAGKLYTAINTSSDAVNKAISTLHLSLVILFILSIIAIFLIALSFLIKVWTLNFNPIGLDQGEKKILERLKDPNCPISLNPKIDKKDYKSFFKKFFSYRYIKFKFVPKDVNFEEFFLTIHPTPYLEFSVILLFLLNISLQIIGNFAGVYESSLEYNRSQLHIMDLLFGLVLTLVFIFISIFLIIFILFTLISSFINYRYFKIDLESFYYKKTYEKSHLLTKQRYKNSIFIFNFYFLGWFDDINNRTILLLHHHLKSE